MHPPEILVPVHVHARKLVTFPVLHIMLAYQEITICGQEVADSNLGKVEPHNYVHRWVRHNQ